MKLSEVNTLYGAPMGRSNIDECYDSEADMEFELEWVPFIDGDYDAAGAYWGSPANLYCYEHLAFNEEAQKDDFIQCFLRAESREEAMKMIREDYPNAIFQKENGSLIKQAITMLEKYINTLDADEDEDIIQDTECEIAGYEEMLWYIEKEQK